MNRRHCRFCAGTRQIESAGRDIPCPACEVKKESRITGYQSIERDGTGIKSISIYEDTPDGRQYIKTVFVIETPNFRRQTENKAAVPRIYKQLKEMEYYA